MYLVDIVQFAFTNYVKDTCGAMLLLTEVLTIISLSS